MEEEKKINYCNGQNLCLHKSWVLIQSSIKIHTVASQNLCHRALHSNSSKQSTTKGKKARNEDQKNVRRGYGHKIMLKEKPSLQVVILYLDFYED